MQSSSNEGDISILREVIACLLGKSASRVDEVIDKSIKDGNVKMNEKGETTYIDLQEIDHLDGCIPESIDKLASLTYLNLSGEKKHMAELYRCTGNIPESIGNLANLSYLNLSFNDFTGVIPESVGNLINLTYLNIRFCGKLIGVIPTSIGKLTKLTYLSLGSCDGINGTIPNSISNLTNLTELCVSSTGITGVIPESVGNLTKLTRLVLNSNKLTGNIPDSVCELTNLEFLSLYNNKLKGAIPEDIGNLANMTALLLSHNTLSGKLPHSIRKLRKLVRIKIGHNQGLSGNLPVFPAGCDIGTENTGVSNVSVVLKPLSKSFWYFDYWLIALYVMLGYVDLITDILSIHQLFIDGQRGVAITNVVFIGIGQFLGIMESDRSCKSIFIILIFASGLLNGIQTLRTGRQTPGLVAGKKLDAVARSMPSTVLQLYSLLQGLQRYNGNPLTLSVLVTSITFAILSSAVTLAGVHPKAGDRLLSRQYLVITCYYLSELTLRVLVIAIAFVAAQQYAFIPFGIDFAFRLCATSYATGEKDVATGLRMPKKIDFSLTCLYMGSDNAIEGDANLDGWRRGSRFTLIEMIIFILVMFGAPSDALHYLREQYAAACIAGLMIVSHAVKTLLYVFINGSTYKFLGKEHSWFYGLKIAGMQAAEVASDPDNGASADIVVNVLQHFA